MIVQHCFRSIASLPASSLDSARDDALRMASVDLVGKQAQGPVPDIEPSQSEGEV